MAKAFQKRPAVASVGLPISCLSWCEEEECSGEHFGKSDDYVPAAAGLPLRCDHNMGAAFPAVGIALRWGQRDHCHPGVSVHVNGQGVDTEFEMQLHEAKALLGSLKRAIRALEVG